MKRFLFLILLTAFCSIGIKAQKVTDEDKVFEKVPIEAGTNEKAWADHIKKKTQLPDSISKDIPAGTYKITVQFIIDKMGNVGDIKALNDPGYGFAQRAEKAVSSYKGEWRPAVQC